jgi:hypothetical protein
LPHIFVGEVLNLFIVDALRKMDNPSLLNRAFAFFERMALSYDGDWLEKMLKAGDIGANLSM